VPLVGLRPPSAACRGFRAMIARNRRLSALPCYAPHHPFGALWVSGRDCTQSLTLSFASLSATVGRYELLSLVGLSPS
jgi:hypothetical protein